jgi:hypothetical protein
VGGTAGEKDDALTWRRRLQLGPRVRPVLSDHRLVGKSPEGSRQRVGDSNSGPPPEVVPGGGCAGGLSCGSLAPLVTARARCAPLPAGFACTHRVQAGSGPVRSRTPPALRSSATRERPAGHGNADRCVEPAGPGVAFARGGGLAWLVVRDPEST